MQTFSSFAKELKKAFPKLSLITAKPYYPKGEDDGLDEQGRPYIIDVALYGEDGKNEILSYNDTETPYIWDQIFGWSVEKGFITSFAISAYKEHEAGGEMLAVELSFDEYKNQDGSIDWRYVMASV